MHKSVGWQQKQVDVQGLVVNRLCDGVNLSIKHALGSDFITNVVVNLRYVIIEVKHMNQALYST